MEELFGHSSSDECQEALSQLYHFLDGQLTVERRTTIQAHIDLCSPCLRAFSFEEELRIVISQKCSEDVPEALRRRIADAIESEPGD